MHHCGVQLFGLLWLLGFGASQHSSLESDRCQPITLAICKNISKYGVN